MEIAIWTNFLEIVEYYEYCMLLFAIRTYICTSAFEAECALGFYRRAAGNCRARMSRMWLILGVRICNTHQWRKTKENKEQTDLTNSCLFPWFARTFLCQGRFYEACFVFGSLIRAYPSTRHTCIQSPRSWSLDFATSPGLTIHEVTSEAYHRCRWYASDYLNSFPAFNSMESNKWYMRV